MACSPKGCNCSFSSSTLAISVEGGVVVIEQAEFTDLVELQDAVAALQGDVAALEAADVSLAARIAVLEGQMPGLERHGCFLTRVGHSATAGAISTVAFNAEGEDTDGYHAGSSANVTVPAGLSGVYVMGVRLQRDAGNWGGGYGILTINGSSYQFAPTGTASMSFAMTHLLGEGTVVTLGMFNGGALTTVNAVLVFYRLPEAA